MTRSIESVHARARCRCAELRKLAMAAAAITATATWACSGVDDQSTAMVTIQAFPEEPPFGSHPQDATLLLFQDGDGPWNKLQGTNGTYSAPCSSGRYAIASICRVGDERSARSSVELYYLGVSDTTHAKVPGCVDFRPQVRVSAQLYGIPSGQSGEVLFGGAPGMQSTDDGPFEARLVRGEPVDVLISTEIKGVPQRVYRGPMLDGLTDQALDYDLGMLGAPLESQPLTVTGLDPAEEVAVLSFLSTRPSQAAWYVDVRPYATTPPDHYSSVSLAAGRQPGDITSVAVDIAATQPSPDGRVYLRRVMAAIKTPAAITLAAPAPWSIETPTIENTALRRATFTLPSSPDGSTAVDYSAHFSALSETTLRHWDMTIAAGWLAGRGAVTVTTPDLTAFVEGLPTIALPLEHDVLWWVGRVERNVDYGVASADGMRMTIHQMIGTIAGSP